MTDIKQIDLQATLVTTAKMVCDLQHQFDAMDHDTTGATFLQEHGKDAAARRGRILGNIDARRTEAIWSLGRVLDALAKGA
jgi:hypothetical protein